MVAIKYIPLAAACLSLCTGVGASVIRERQGGQPTDMTTAVTVPLGSPSSPFGGRASSYRAADDTPSTSPASTSSIEGKVPGSVVASPGDRSRTLANVTPGANLPVIDVGLVANITGTLGDILAVLASIVPLTGQDPPAPPSTSTLASLVAAIQALLARLPTSGTVPPGTDVLFATLLGLLSSLPVGSLGGAVPSTPVSITSLTDVISLLTALLPLLTSLVAVLQPAAGL